MSGERPLPLVGAPGSPYTRKLRAVLRYRRIPHAFVIRGAPEARALPRPRVELLPQLVLEGPDGPEAVTDSTPLLRWLREARAELAAGDRAAVDAILAGTGCERLFADLAA